MPAKAESLGSHREWAAKAKSVRYFLKYAIPKFELGVDERPQFLHRPHSLFALFLPHMLFPSWFLLQLFVRPCQLFAPAVCALCFCPSGLFFWPRFVVPFSVLPHRLVPQLIVFARASSLCPSCFSCPSGLCPHCFLMPQRRGPSAAFCAPAALFSSLAVSVPLV